MAEMASGEAWVPDHLDALGLLEDPVRFWLVHARQRKVLNLMEQTYVLVDLFWSIQEDMRVLIFGERFMYV